MDKQVVSPTSKDPMLIAYLKGTASANEQSNFNEDDETKSATHVIPPELDPRVRNGVSSTGRSSTSTRRLSTATTSIHHKLLEAQLNKDDSIDGFRHNRRVRRGSICASEISRPMTPSGFPHAQSEIPVELDDQKKQQSYKDLSLSAQLLSRHLEAGRTKMDIKKILIVVKHHDDTLPPRASELVAWLLAQPEGFIMYNIKSPSCCLNSPNRFVDMLKICLKQREASMLKVLLRVLRTVKSGSSTGQSTSV
jgi:hypothetical protein